MTSLAAERPIRSRTAGVPFAEAIFGFVARSHARACALLVVLVARLLPAGLRLAPADGPRRAALRAGLEADARDGRFRRHPLPGRGPAQEAGRDLLAAGRRRSRRRGARRAGRAHDDRALPHALAPRRARDGAPDLLGRARLRRPARGVPRRGLRGRLDDPDGRGAAREDGRRARRLLRSPPWARSPAPISRAARHGFRSRPCSIFWIAVARSASWSRGRWCRCSPRLPCWRCSSASARRAGSWRCGPVSACSSCWRVALPWFVAIAVKSGGAFFAESVGHDMLGKVGTAQTYHWAAARLLSPRLLRHLLAGRDACRHRDSVRLDRTGADDRVAFALAWIVPAWLVFETRADEAAALRPAALSGDRDRRPCSRSSRGFVAAARPGARSSRRSCIPFIPVGLAVGACLRGLDPRRAPALGRACRAASRAPASPSTAWWRFVRDEPGAARAPCASPPRRSSPLGVFGLRPAGAAIARGCRRVSPRPRAGSIARSRAVGTLGYREPSLVFLAGTELRDVPESASEAAEFLKAAAVASPSSRAASTSRFRPETERAGISPALLARLSGFNINGGRRLEIGAYAVRP